MTYFKKYTEKNVFKNIKYLNPQCIPREFHHRENEMETIASYIAPILYGGVPNHAVIIGDNATGKTTAIQKLFQEITETIPDIIPVYINCRKHNTPYTIYGQIYKKVLNTEAPHFGSSTRNIFKKIMKELTKTNKALIIALDDANYLLGSKNTASPTAQNIIRELTRVNESYNIIVGIYPIITSQEFKYQFEQEVNTLFTPREVYFKPYNREQYTHIIKERCNIAFNIPIQEEVIELIVQKITKTKNIRLAWDILREFGIKLNETNQTQTEIITKILKKEL